MHYSSLARLRDLLFLIALVFLVKIAFERTASFISAHKNSMVHELDRTFLDQMYVAQRQLHFLEEHPLAEDSIYGKDFSEILSDLKKRLATIEEKYKTNSPGVMLLGPIGSAAIVAKEEKLQKKLLEVVNDMNKLLHLMSNKVDEFQYVEKIDIALDSNKKLLQEIII